MRRPHLALLGSEGSLQLLHLQSQCLHDLLLFSGSTHCALRHLPAPCHLRLRSSQLSLVMALGVLHTRDMIGQQQPLIHTITINLVINNN